MIANALGRETLSPRPAPRLGSRLAWTGASPLARARLVPSAFPREREIGLRSHRHHQHHGPCVPDQLERHEIRIQCVLTP
jgi:hypothetical protein